MKLVELVDAFDLEVRSARGCLENEVTGGYASDLLSDVLANSNRGNIWVTLQIHLNIVAVASMKELAGIILVNGREPQEDALQKAETENVPLMVSRLPSFELVGRLYKFGIGSASVQGTAESGDN